MLLLWHLMAGAILIGHQCRMLLAAVGQLEHQLQQKQQRAHGSVVAPGKCQVERDRRADTAPESWRPCSVGACLSNWRPWPALGHFLAFPAPLVAAALRIQEVELFLAAPSDVTSTMECDPWPQQSLCGVIVRLPL
jgi:hypothetical protein